MNERIAHATWLLLGMTLLLGTATEPLMADAVSDYLRGKKTVEQQLLAGKFDDAARTALQLRRLAAGPLRYDSTALIFAVDCQAHVCYAKGEYDAALNLFRWASQKAEQVYGAYDRDTAMTLNNLATVLSDLGKYAEAERYQRRVIDIMTRVSGPQHPDVALALNNLGTIYYDGGRLRDAQRFFLRAVAIWERQTTQLKDLGMGLNNLAQVYANQGRYAEAEPLLQRSLQVYQRTVGANHPDLAMLVNNLGVLKFEQGRRDEATRDFERASVMVAETLGSNHPKFGLMLHNRAVLHREKNPDEAAQLARRAVEIYEKSLGPRHPALALPLNNLGYIYGLQKRYDDSIRTFERALRVREQATGPMHTDVVLVLTNLASVYSLRHDYAKAMDHITRALSTAEQCGSSFWVRATALKVRATIAWKTGQSTQAIDDLQAAINLVEQQRAAGSGGAVERARLFARFTDFYEQMILWQAELQKIDKILDALERSRARSLIDQMALRGVDLLAGLPAEEAARLTKREDAATYRIASLERELTVLDRRKDLSARQLQTRCEELQKRLNQARANFAAAFAAIRNASPAYRLTVGRSHKPVTLKHLAEWVGQKDGLLLEYFFGTDGGCVLVVPADGDPRFHMLEVSEPQAKVLGIEPGPLTAKRLQQVMNHEEGAGVLQRLRQTSDPAKLKDVIEPLAALWELLIPEEHRKMIVSDQCQRLFVVPDGTLGQLPFATLVVERGDTPKYLLNVGPSIQYAPSATVLVNLAEQKVAAAVAAAEPVLTVGNPRYIESSSPSVSVLAQLAPRSRYGASGGSLKPLPFTAWEVQWLADVFEKHGIKVAQLKEDQATERAVRHNAKGRRIVHLACHGLVDQAHGNLFGALALTPDPASAGPTDDGFLTLAEVYALDLRGCELAILSACDTNVGPQQQGEGLWALSRGFLVAGSRRVVASNWLVDDQAAASLVSYYCSLLAKGEENGQEVDYAEALHKAKKWIREQEKWSSPYYWGTFVLMGPN
jgi:CHAT domain-containing protein/Tfp pilus assembly protein PilF